jgi:hypothetical protein
MNMFQHGKARIAASLFIGWGLMHIAGGAAILFALADGSQSGYAVYRNSAGSFPPISGAVLGYLAYSFLWLGALVVAVGATSNWHNSARGLALNTALVGLTDLGLVCFMVLPGYVTWMEASAGLLLFVAALILGGLACNAKSTRTPT